MTNKSIPKLSELLEVTKKIDRLLAGTGRFDLSTRTFVLKSYEGIMEYSVVAEPLTELKQFIPVSFEDINLRRVTVISSPNFSDQSACISTFGSSVSRNIIFNPQKLESNAGSYNFKFEIECDIETITGDLVTRNHQIETSDDEKSTYWLSAELKELSSVVPLLKRMELTDIPFSLDVAIHQDVKVKFPNNRQKELELIAEWARSSDRNIKQAIDFQHIRLKKEHPKQKDITKVLGDLQNLFVPYRFSDFIEVLKEFYYSDCLRGAEFYDQIPFRSFPKWMSVICRTSVSTDKPASDGELVYKKGEFQAAVEDAVKEK